jgi:hypothetical protein
MPERELQDWRKRLWKSCRQMDQIINARFMRFVENENMEGSPKRKVFANDVCRAICPLRTNS